MSVYKTAQRFGNHYRRYNSNGTVQFYAWPVTDGGYVVHGPKGTVIGRVANLREFREFI